MLSWILAAFMPVLALSQSTLVEQVLTPSFHCTCLRFMVAGLVIIDYAKVTVNKRKRTQESFGRVKLH